MTDLEYQLAVMDDDGFGCAITTSPAERQERERQERERQERERQERERQERERQERTSAWRRVLGVPDGQPLPRGDLEGAAWQGYRDGPLASWERYWRRARHEAGA
jgi:hypothetical protein